MRVTPDQGGRHFRCAVRSAYILSTPYMTQNPGLRSCPGASPGPFQRIPTRLPGRRPCRINPGGIPPLINCAMDLGPVRTASDQPAGRKHVDHKPDRRQEHQPDRPKTEPAVILALPREGTASPERTIIPGHDTTSSSSLSSIHPRASKHNDVTHRNPAFYNHEGITGKSRSSPRRTPQTGVRDGVNLRALVDEQDPGYQSDL